MYKVLIAEDEERIRMGLAKLVGTDSELQVCALADDGKKALQAVHKENPDILLVDINMPFLNGLSFIEELGDAARNAVIIIITGYDNFKYAQRALRLGVFEYLLKPLEDDVFFDALRRAKVYLENVKKKSEYGNILEQLADKTNLPPLVLRTKKFIEQHCHDPLFSFQGAAEELNISPQHLSRIFRQEAGITLMDYLSQARVRRAEVLLLNTDMRMYEIAEQVGYTSQHYFSSAFKRILGTSPAEYRKRNNKKDDA
ncbi:MAG: response regulator [Treponema sp.]|jgi:two-component system response regulator YesN|nr:response regulator [Treponema sp.]